MINFLNSNSNFGAQNLAMPNFGATPNFGANPGFAMNPAFGANQGTGNAANMEMLPNLVANGVTNPADLMALMPGADMNTLMQVLEMLLAMMNGQGNGTEGMVPGADPMFGGANGGNGMEQFLGGATPVSSGGGGGGGGYSGGGGSVGSSRLDFG
jgi:hypothetical protein